MSIEEVQELDFGVLCIASVCSAHAKMPFILGMGSGIVRSAIDGVVEKTPSNLSRSCKLRKWALILTFSVFRF